MMDAEAEKIRINAAEIKHTTSGRVLVAFLKLELNAAQTAMINTKDTNNLFNLQGRATQLLDLIKFFSEK